MFNSPARTHSDVAEGMITGFGDHSYILGLDALLEILKKRQWTLTCSCQPLPLLKCVPRYSLQKFAVRLIGGAAACRGIGERGRSLGVRMILSEVSCFSGSCVLYLLRVVALRGQGARDLSRRIDWGRDGCARATWRRPKSPY